MDTTQQLAPVVEEKIRIDFNNAKTKTPNSIKDLFELFVKHQRAEGKSLVTIKNYKDNFKLLLKFRADIKLENLTEETIVDFLEYLNTRQRVIGNEMIIRPCKNSTIATVMGKLGSFFSWLAERKHIKSNPFENISYPDVSYTDKRAFTDEEVKTILDTVIMKICWPNLLLKKRNIAIIMFLLLTGVRKGELLGMCLSGIDLKNKTTTVRGETSKSKRTRIIPMSPDLPLYLEDYFAEREDYTTDALWVSGNDDRGFTEHGMKHFINHLTEVTGINCHLHRFRHTFAVNYYRRTNDLVGLSRLLGHKSLKMTLVYLRSLSDDHVVEQMHKMSLASFA